MDKVTLGSTGITVCKNGFGALPIQRVTKDEAVRIIRKACQGGIQFFDTAIKYTDSGAELDQWLSCIDNPPRMTVEMKDIIEKDRAELAGDFCRGCGYCAPCTVGIKINECARMSQLIRRSPSKRLLEQETIDKMRKVNECIECGVCMTRCPYELKIPELLRKNLEDYENILAGKTKVAIV